MKQSLTLTLLFCLFFSVIYAQDNNPLIASRPIIETAVKKYDEGLYKEAIALYKKIPRSDTNYVWALYELGMSYTADSQFTEALKVYTEGLSIKQEREREPDLYNNYASLIDDMGDHEKALAIYDTAIAKYPTYSPLMLNKATTLLKLNRSVEAESLLQKNLLINPYSISSHYMLGLAALQQGKIVQSFISYFSYLMMSPDGRYFQNCINNLSVIANNRDDIRPFIDNRKESPSESYQLLEQIILSKIALDKNYKSLVKLDDAICRQIQVLFEKMEYNASDNDFWMQYYIPLYKKLFEEKKFETYVYYIFSNVNIESIQSYNKKNKKEKDALISEIVAYLNDIRVTRELFFENRKIASTRYIISDGAVSGKGTYASDGEKLVGPWEFYYPAGNLRSAGKYNNNGEQEGTWTFYYQNGSKRVIENYVNGQLEGEAIFYFENGNLSSRILYHDNKEEGESISFYLSGSDRTKENYKNGKLDGEKRIYYTNGMLHYIENYVADSLAGKAISYHQNGLLESTSNYANGKIDGPIKGYHENGQLSYEGQYNNDEISGTWKRYHENGQLKAIENYVNGLMEGEYIEYYDNGKKSQQGVFKNGKSDGDLSYFDDDGILYSILTYDKEMLKTARYFDKTGKQISASNVVNKKMNLVTYRPDGTKRSQLNYNEKGEAEGVETIYYPSGKVSETNNYVDGLLQGTSVTYHLNGKKSLEVEYTEHKKNGYYKTFHSNGKVSYEGWFQDGESQGNWITTDELGTIMMQTATLNSETHGVSQEFWPNGKLQEETINQHGWVKTYTQFDTTGKVIHKIDLSNGTGKYTMVHLNGKLYAEADYIKGSLDGIYKYYYFDGSPFSISYYKRGLRDSIYKQYFYGGQLQTSGQFRMGEKTGTWTNYKENGKKYTSEQYLNGEVHGKRLYYFDNGKTDTEVSYESGSREGWLSKFDSTGALIYKIKYDNDLPISYTYSGKDGQLIPEIPFINNSGKLTSYYANGNLSATLEFSDGHFVGSLKYYHSNGKIRSESTEQYGESEGPMREFYPDGQLKAEWIYSGDNPHGKYTTYNSKGVKIEEGTYYNGELNGPVKYYKENGQLKETRIYYFGTLLDVKK